MFPNWEIKCLQSFLLWNMNTQKYDSTLRSSIKTLIAFSYVNNQAYIIEGFALLFPFNHIHEILCMLFANERQRKLKVKLNPRNKLYWCLPFAISANCISIPNYDTLHFRRTSRWQCNSSLKSPECSFQVLVEGCKKKLFLQFHFTKLLAKFKSTLMFKFHRFLQQHLCFIHGTFAGICQL